MSLRLYLDAFWISPYSFTAFVALREKGVPFDITPVALHEQQQRAAALRDALPTGRIPALVDGDFALAESSAIVEYLEERFPAPAHPRLLPEGLRERAVARQLLGWIRSDLDALRAERPTSTMFYDRPAAPLSEAGEAAARKLVAVAARVIPAGQTALFGAFSVADADLAFMLHRLIRNGHELPAPVRAFAEAVWRRPSVAAFVAAARPPYVDY